MKRLLLLALPLAIAACTTPPQEPPATEAAPPTATMDGRNPDADALAAQHWRLQDAKDANGQRIDALFVRADAPLQLDFSDGRIAVANACNRMGGGFALDGDSLRIERTVSTMMACTDPKLMALDGEAGKRLEGTLKAGMPDPATLTLATASGDVLTFRGEPTAETRYGGPSERVFLEVAAQTRPCNHPLIPDMRCLQVRELKYDDNGLKVGTPGAFGNFYDRIEGYTHEPGTRNVLRVDRYTIKNPSADASKYAYVLDMVVESDASTKQ